MASATNEQMRIITCFFCHRSASHPINNLPMMLAPRIIESTFAATACVYFRSMLKNNFRFWIVPATAPIEHMLPLTRRQNGQLLSIGVMCVFGSCLASCAFCSGLSLTNHAIGKAIAIISKPSIIKALCHPKFSVSARAIWGTSIPPTPIPMQAIPIAFPRALSNHRAMSTWFGNGPPHIQPSALNKQKR